jgi:membrane peptidoglycan carboxypeptidase
VDAKWKTLAKLVASLVAAGVLAAGVAMPIVLGSGIAARNEANRFLSTSCDLQESAPPQKTYVYARDGKTLIATLFSQDRQLVPLSKVPQYLQDALIATEDRRFYSHHGVDLRGLIRSAISTSGGDTQGGSTLTMQYVKQIRYFQAGDDQKKQEAAIAQNLQRKIEDAKCALYFENTKHESKATILDNYLNIAFFGEHAYGIETAAQTYFGKSVNELTLAQSAMLVGLLRAPSAYDPFVYPAAAKARRDDVLQNLVSVGKLSQKQADQQKASPIALATHKPPTVQQGCANASPQVANSAFFCEYAENWLENVNGISADKLNTGGYKIVTTLNPKIQNAAQKHINETVPAKAATTAVLPAVDPQTGDVLAMASSKTFGSGAGQTEQPIFTSTTANGASTFKLFPMLAALSTGIPSSYQLKTVGNTGTYHATGCAIPGNVVNGDANVSYDTVESMKQAIANSDNSYFVALAEKGFGCQLQPIVDLMKKMGMTGLDEKTGKTTTLGSDIVAQQRAQNLVLGSVSTSALQLASAYATVADNGVYHAPSPILSITDSHGNDVPVKRTAGTAVVAPQVAQEAVNLLIGDTKSGGTSADTFGSHWYDTNSSDIAGKTGTTDLDKPYKGKNGTVWFVGLTPNLVAASGLINFDTPSKPSTGIKSSPGGKTLAPGAAYGDSAARVWLDALGGTLKSKSWTWPDPQDFNGVQVPDITGQSVSDAKKTLAGYGLKLSIIGEADNALCYASAPYGTIGYFGPSVAVRGSTVTACQSFGEPAYSPPVVRVNPPTQHTNPTTGASGTAGAGSGGGSSGTPGAGGGGGGGGSTGTPGAGSGRGNGGTTGGPAH